MRGTAARGELDGRGAHGETTAADRTGRGPRGRGVRDRDEPRLPGQGVRRPASQIAQLQQEKARELAAIKDLDDRRKQLQDPGYIKRQARERLFYCDPGQKCYVVMGEQPSPGKGTAGEKKAVRPPWYQTLWESVEAARHGEGHQGGQGRGVTRITWMSSFRGCHE